MNKLEYIEKNNNKFKIIIQNLYNKYISDIIIIEKLHNYIENNLSNHLEQICLKEKKKHNNLLETINIREEKKVENYNNQQLFINRFLQLNNYYYINNTDIFIYYNNLQFKTTKEDNILHNILSNISLDKKLLPWKYKIKDTIIKKIKYQNIFAVIPNSDTIQNCLNLLIPYIFSCKEETKYFLTIIGDCILKKNEDLIYLININFKEFFKILSDHCYFFFGTNLNNNFKYKYHEQHNHSNYRLLQYKLNNINLLEINKNILDILCVAIHYSNRFCNSDQFLENIDNDELTFYSFYLKNNSMDKVIDEFINKELVKSDNSSISFKNMLYIWKKFLSDKNIPNLIFQNTFRLLLKEKIIFNNDEDIFINVFSPSLPIVNNFIQFWDETISEDEMNLELNELNLLFKQWSKVQTNLKSKLILDIVKYYYPDVVIEKDKYFLNITCSIWNKKEDIEKSIEEIKRDLKNKNESYPIAIDYLYDKYCQNKKNNLIINKKEFEKYIKYNLVEFIDNDNLILPEWWNR